MLSNIIVSPPFSTFLFGITDTTFGVYYKNELDESVFVFQIEYSNGNFVNAVKISDNFVKMKEIIKTSELIKKSDIIIIGAPHSTYKNLKIPKNKFLIDSWGLFEK